jgi:hypothetical protein
MFLAKAYKLRYAQMVIKLQNDFVTDHLDVYPNNIFSNHQLEQQL